MRTTPLQMPQSPIATDVFMEKLSSCEMHYTEKMQLTPVLREISLSIRKGETWAINGSSLLEIRLLLDIMANIRPYHSGVCKLAELGMMRRKRIILPHVFYIGNPGMIYNNMNVLEYLMFAMAKRPGDTVLRQEWLFEYLIRIGLGYLSLTPAGVLSREEKAVVLLLVGVLSDSRLVIFNFPDYRFDEGLSCAIAQMAALIRENGKTLVLGTQNGDLIEGACTHIAFLHGGRILYDGPVRKFCETYDKVLLTVWDEQIASWADRLKTELPQYLYKIRGDSLIISGSPAGENDPERIYRKMINSGFLPRKVVVNPKKVENACEEIVRAYDIQE